MRAIFNTGILRTVLLIVIALVSITCAFATSYIFTIEEKVATCTAILRVRFNEADVPLNTTSSMGTAICKASVLEILKGPADLKNVEFRFHPYAIHTSEKLPGMIGTEYYVFLHTPYSNQFWVFEGPSGIRPITNEYQECRVVDGKIVYDTYSRSNYVAKIRELVAKPKVK